jgi:hypothetical protein
MYRPTVRYADVYRDYIDQVFQATTLDRNQIIRLALFIAANSEDYRAILAENMRDDSTSLPHAKWSLNQANLWREQEPTEIEEGGTSFYVKSEGEATTRSIVTGRGNGIATGATTPGENTRREGEVRQRIKATGGLTLTLS